MLTIDNMLLLLLVLLLLLLQDVQRAQHLLLFLRDAAPLLPPRDCSALCTSMLKLTSLGSPPLTAAVMQVHTSALFTTVLL
jgi:hypothetical protein